jgi:hypothetical protein
MKKHLPDHSITSESQQEPEPHRRAFLNGVMIEAAVQGYSYAATGRLWVVALRQWEGR